MPGGTATAAVATVTQQQQQQPQQQQQQEVPPTSSNNQSDSDQVESPSAFFTPLNRCPSTSFDNDPPPLLPYVPQVQNLALRCASAPRVTAVKTEYPDRKDPSKLICNFSIIYILDCTLNPIK